MFMAYMQPRQGLRNSHKDVEEHIDMVAVLRDWLSACATLFTCYLTNGLTPNCVFALPLFCKCIIVVWCAAWAVNPPVDV